jgi:hypothetical protein
MYSANAHQLGGLKKTLKKVGKAIKKPLLVAAGGAALYFGAGPLAAPLLKKGLAKKDSLTAAEKLQIALANGGIVDPNVPLFIPGSEAGKTKISPLLIAGGILGLALILRSRK